MGGAGGGQYWLRGRPRRTSVTPALSFENLERRSVRWKPWRMLRLLLKTSPTAPFIENLDRSLVCWRRSSNRLCGKQLGTASTTQLAVDGFLTQAVTYHFNKRSHWDNSQELTSLKTHQSPNSFPVQNKLCIKEIGQWMQTNKQSLMFKETFDKIPIMEGLGMPRVEGVGPTRMEGITTKMRGWTDQPYYYPYYKDPAQGKSSH